MKPSSKKKTIEPALVDQLEVLDNRCKLREYCIQNNIKTPDFFASDQFLKISQWAMKKNSFPLCIKSAKNLSNNQLIFVLKAYRELPEFFETIQAKTNNDKVIIEEFIEGKAYLEVTIFDKKVRLISQISLSKTMKLQQKWRAFPLRLPDNIFAKIENIIKAFDKLCDSSTTTPLRFSFVIKNLEPILISINSDNNRLEYLEDWRETAGLEPLINADYPSTTSKISKINFYKIKDRTYDFSNAAKLCNKSLVKYEQNGNKLNFMLSSENSKDLAEDFEKANAVIKQIIESE